MKSNPSSVKRVASIDIGTNTILLLIAEVDQGRINPLFEMETVVRLGESVQETGVISPQAMDRGLQTLTQYLKQCQGWEVQRTFCRGDKCPQGSQELRGLFKTR